MTGWKSTSLGEACQFINGLWKGEVPPLVHVGVIRNTNFTKDGALDDSDIAYLDVEAKKFAKRRLQYGDLILEKSGGGPKQPVGRVVLFDKTDGDYSFSNFTAAMRVIESDKLDPLYLHRYLHWIYVSGRTEAMQSHSTGIRNLNGDAYKRITVDFPPLPEQRRLVAILDEAFEAIATAKANTEKNLQNAREVFESYLAAIFSARNEGWTDRCLKSLCQRITVGHVGSMAKRYKPTGIPFLRSQNIRPFSVSMQNLVFIDEQFHASLGKSSLETGDVAIVRTGYPGTAAVIPHSLGVANCSDLVIVKPGPEIDAHFLCAFFNSAFGKEMVSGKVVGAAQKHFNVGAAKDVLLHLPPLAEQQAIVAASDEVRDQTNRLEGVCVRKLTALDELKKSLLHQAFTGQLTAKTTDQQLKAMA
ncbi:restriction endonuclease subunit S [Stenotrophomonas sp. NPDC078853]|uniref:restriction endonuclease subunit S n=1 Tax=Stenotrophomonas sp. NPDC078853 TaxID=3364534 RepID=UPI00384E94D6